MEAAIFFLVVLISIVIFDFWVIAKKGKQASLSAWMIRYSKKFPIMPFLLGIAFGHLTWSMSDFDWMKKDDLIKKCKTYLEENADGRHINNK